ncbi:MAG: nucleotidyl transferase AbiEii/AbiGii toxin family protein [candidate division WOR-3 bacterium]|nr:nucleotidyl transferase AbiEii/AbiGii toxin family protein [candidate division WOR-3 bacterium]
MELKRKRLLKKHKKAIIKIAEILKEGFYLAGGTAVYYYLNHRHSLDLDFFIDKKIDLRKFRPFFQEKEIKLLSEDTIHTKVENIYISLFYYPYFLLKPLINFDLIKIASLEDILCMKINALIPRGSKKDFFDVYFIMEHLNLKSEEVIALFTQKFGKYDKLIIKKALTYFEDAEKEPEFPLIKKVKWQKVKNFFIKEFAQL